MITIYLSGNSSVNHCCCAVNPTRKYSAMYILSETNLATHVFFCTVEHHFQYTNYALKYRVLFHKYITRKF